jgi:hypothetical protein
MRIQGKLLFSILLLAGLSHAQNIAGTITGVVEDPSGARVIGATISAVNQATNVRYSSTTTEAGIYVIPELPLGDYTVTVEAGGFKKSVRSDLPLGADARLRVDVRLELGGGTETVTVSGAVQLVESERATVGGSFTRETFDALPIGRDPLNALALIPGSTAALNGFATGVFNGGHEETTDYKVDGAAATFATTYRAGSGQPIEEMVEEVVLQSGNYSAEFGRGSSQITVNTIAGTNQFHGTLFEYFQNEDLNANSFINNRNGTPRSVQRQNLFGATTGGPIWVPKLYNGRNRTFFTIGFEGTRSHVPASFVSTVPTAAIRAGNFVGQPTVYDPATTAPSGSSYARTPFPGNIVPANRFDPVALNILANSFPLPNAAGTANGANNYVSAGSSPLSNTFLQARLDHNFSEKNRLTGRFFRWYQTVFNFDRWPGPSGAPTKNNVQNNDTQDTIISLEHTYILRADLVNTLRFGYFREKQTLFGPGTDENWAGQVGLKGAGPEEFPLVAITGLTGFGGANLARSIPGQNYSLAETLLMVKGRHSLKVGFEFRYLQDKTYQPGGAPAGNFSFNTQPTNNPATNTLGNAFASYLLGIPNSSSLSVYPHAPIDVYWPYYSAFVQDDFRVSKKLTLNLGLRWEINMPYKESHNYMSAFNLRTGTLDLAGQNGYPDTLSDPNYKSFAPRFGFAYSPFDNNKTVVRGGYGIFWLPNSAIGGAPFEGVGPWATNVSYPTPDGINFPITLAGGFPPVTLNVPVVISPALSVNTVQRNFTQPYMQQWSLSVQRQLDGHTLLEVGYVGNNGHHLESNLQLNQVPANLLGPGNAQARRPYPNVGSIRDGAAGTPVGNSTYEALQIRMQRRFQHGFSAQVAYTFSKSLDEFLGNLSFGSFSSTGLQDNNNIRAEKSLSVFNQPNKLNWAFIWQLPVGKGRDFLNRGGWLNILIGGWNLSTLSSLESGMPLVMTTAQNLTGSIDGGSRPNRLARGALSGSERGLNEWFNPAAFVSPPAYTFGSDSRTEPSLYAPGALNISAMLQKEIHFGEKRFIDFRCQAGNVLNHFNPGMPNTSIGAPGVGTITAGNGGRGLTLTLKVHY